MLALLGGLLLASTIGAFLWSLHRGNFRRYPYEQLILASGAAALGVVSVVREPLPLHLALAGVELVTFVAVVWYMGIGDRFRRGEVSVKEGERFPHFTLPDSQGRAFDSASLEGRSAALYLFYRGNW